MPNIRQQEKRVRQAARQRAENLRWRSTAKTLMRRLKEAVDSGDSTAVDARSRELASWLDRATSKGALHKNTAARRKAQAARLVAAPPAPAAKQPASKQPASKQPAAKRSAPKQPASK